MEGKSFQTEFLIVGKEKDSFIESYIGDDVKKDSEISFFVALEIVNKFDDGEDIGEALTETFRKVFYDPKVNFDVYTRFEEALKAMNEVARALEEQGDFVLSNANIAVGAMENGVLYLTQSNEAEVYLVRKGYVSNISDGLSSGGKKKKGADLFENVATGELESGDMVLFSTTRLFRYVSQTELGRLFFGKDLDQAVMSVEDALRTEVLGRVGVVFMKYYGNDNYNNNDNDGKSKGKNKIKGKNGKGRILDKVDLGRAGAAVSKAGGFLGGMFGRFFSGRIEKIDPEVRKKVLMMIVSIFLVLFLGLYFLFTRGIASPEVKQYREIIAQGYSIIDAAKKEVDKSRINDLLVSAEAKAEQAMTVRSLRGEASKLLQEVQDVRFTLDEVTIVDNPTQVADISSFFSDVSLMGVKFLNGSFFAYDNTRLFEVISGEVKDPYSFAKEANLIDAAVLPDYESIVFSFDNGSISEYESGVLKNMDVDGQVNSSVDIFGFGSRIYLLDPDNGQIWRHSRRRDSYGSAEGYFDDSQVVNAASFAIDGSIFVGLTTGDIQEFYLGALAEDFVIDDEPLLPVESVDDIYTAEDLPYIFVLEADKNRVLEYYKNPNNGRLEYVNQYFFETLDEVRGFTVDYEARKLYVVDSGILYSTDLK